MLLDYQINRRQLFGFGKRQYKTVKSFFAVVILMKNFTGDFGLSGLSGFSNLTLW